MIHLKLLFVNINSLTGCHKPKLAVSGVTVCRTEDVYCEDVFET
jgi:hypothetical protein